MEGGTFQLHHEVCYGQLVKMLQAPKTKGKKTEHTVFGRPSGPLSHSWEDGNTDVATWKALFGIHLASHTQSSSCLLWGRAQC